MKTVEHYIAAAADLIRPVFRPDDQLASEDRPWDSDYAVSLQRAAFPVVDKLTFTEKARLAAALFRHSTEEDLSYQAVNALRTVLDRDVLRLHNSDAILTAEEIAEGLDYALFLRSEEAFPDGVVDLPDFLARVRWAVLALPQPDRRAAA